MVFMEFLARRWPMAVGTIAALEAVGIAALVAKRRAERRATRIERLEHALETAVKRVRTRDGAERERRLAALVRR